MIRVESPLTEAEENIVHEVMDCAFAVHRALDPGFREKIYATAFRLELELRGLPFECEKSIAVKYKEWMIPGHRVDLIVANVVLVEIKAIPKLAALHRAQVLSYLRTTGLRVGLLMNFNAEVLRHGLRRVVN